MSLILNNIDKAMHSSAKKGYILKNGTLPNPMDMALVFLQSTFPLDYILYLCMVLFFLITSISGVKRIGIRFMWLPLYKIAPHSTKVYMEKFFFWDYSIIQNFQIKNGPVFVSLNTNQYKAF